MRGGFEIAEDPVEYNNLDARPVDVRRAYSRYMGWAYVGRRAFAAAPCSRGGAGGSAGMEFLMAAGDRGTHRAHPAY